MTPAFFTEIARQGDRPALILPGAGADLCRACGAGGCVCRAIAGDKGLLALEFASEPAAIIAYLAALRAGHAVLAMPPDAPEVLAGAEARFQPDWVYARVGANGSCGRGGRRGRVHPDLALVLLTSGSTGAGKAVRISAAALAANAAQIATGLALQAEDRAALVLPLHYSYGLSVLNSQLAVGGSVWLHPGSVQRHGFGPAMASAGCTIFAGVPHSYRLLERVAELPPLRMMTVAGGRMEPEAVTRWARHQAKAGGQFVVMYGQTEATARMAILPPDLVLDHPDAVGRAVPGGTLRLRDDKGREITAPV
ncbi:AMP-binding protein [Gemmobacter lanyuensis]